MVDSFDYSNIYKQLGIGATVGATIASGIAFFLFKGTTKQRLLSSNITRRTFFWQEILIGCFTGFVTGTLLFPLFILRHHLRHYIYFINKKKHI